MPTLLDDIAKVFRSPRELSVAPRAELPGELNPVEEPAESCGVII
jgi:hypothetical protein